jgi:hypothetical protein
MTVNTYSYMKYIHIFLVLLFSIPAFSNDIGVPGPKDCFWSRGPHSADPYINLAYPDANVFYWAATFTMPEDVELYLDGDFPLARYMSIISYDGRGRPLESLADYLIEPEKDSINPFINSNSRIDKNRAYKIQVLNNSPVTDRETGKISKISSYNTLNAPSYGPNQQLIIYRVYLPDNKTGPLGGVNLPQLKVIKDGKTYSGNDACKILNASQNLAITIDAAGIPPMMYRELASQTDKPETWPAKNPPEWYIQMDRQSLIGIYTGEFNNKAPRSTGGFFPNLDNHYLRTIINRKYGKVVLLKAKAPLTPKTYNSNPTYKENELRYWSVCSNQSFGNTRVNDCLFDEEIPLDKNGYFTIFVSRLKDRPRNANKECGYAWLPMAEDGDGVFDEDVSIIQFRHMLARDDFSNSIQSVESQNDTKKVMKEYFPKSRYFMKNQVESFFPCITE